MNTIEATEKVTQVGRGDIFFTLWDDYATKLNALMETIEDAGIDGQLLKDVVQAARKVECMRTADYISNALRQELRKRG